MSIGSSDANVTSVTSNTTNTIVDPSSKSKNFDTSTIDLLIKPSDNDAKIQAQANAEIIRNAAIASSKGEDFGDALLKGMFADLTKRGRPLTYSELRDMYG
jgi:hypothetical protein